MPTAADLISRQFFAAIQKLIDAPAPIAQVLCSRCGGSGETHSAERDLCCPVCDGVGLLPADWKQRRERAAAAQEDVVKKGV